MVRNGKQMVVPPDYRYHRYLMQRKYIYDAMFKDDEDYLKAHPLDALGFYDYKVHKHVTIKGLFKHPPGAS
jgi:hypothetical protein